jgi:hypothetical protein
MIRDPTIDARLNPFGNIRQASIAIPLHPQRRVVVDIVSILIRIFISNYY